MWQEGGGIKVRHDCLPKNSFQSPWYEHDLKNHSLPPPYNGY